MTSHDLAALEERAARSLPAKLEEVGEDVQTLQLANAVKVTIKPLAEERGSALIRVLIPGELSTTAPPYGRSMAPFARTKHNCGRVSSASCSFSE